ncbi:MAG: hypothetical protein ABH950_03585 [Candidatus Altiarchaeota archaeon]
MIGYEELKNIYRLEKESPSLQKIPVDFYVQVKDTLCSVEDKHKENITDLFQEIYSRRLGKILRAALRNIDGGKPPENVVEVEKKLYTQLTEVLASHQRDITETVSGVCPPLPEPEKEIELVKVKLLKATPQFVGIDMAEYGPYAEDDTAELPAENAKIFIEQQVAEEVKPHNS